MENKRVYVCTVCGHIHNEYVDGSWENLPKYWNCPECGSAKEEYDEVII